MVVGLELACGGVRGNAGHWQSVRTAAGTGGLAVLTITVASMQAERT